MDNDIIIRHIKAGRSNKYICSEYTKDWNRFGCFRSSADYNQGTRLCTTFDSVDDILDGIRALGFALRLCHTDSCAWGDTDVYAGEHSGFFMELSIPHNRKPRKRITFKLFMLSPDKRFWELDDYARDENDYTNVTDMVKDFMNEWYQKREELRAFRKSVEDLRRQYTDGVGPTGAIIRGLVKQSTFEYNVVHEKDCSYLMIRLAHDRYLELKLLHHMDTSRLDNLAEMIHDAGKALDAAGDLQVQVCNYGNNIKWTTAQCAG